MGSGCSRGDGLTPMDVSNGEESGLQVSSGARSGIPALGTGCPRCPGVFRISSPSAMFLRSTSFDSKPRQGRLK